MSVNIATRTMGTPGAYVICEYGKIREYFPEFQDIMTRLKENLIAKAIADWAPLKRGGLAAEAGEFSETTIIPALFNDITGTRLITWDQWFSAAGALPIPGSRTIMTGAGPGGTIAEDYKVGLVGLAFLSKAIRISEIKMQISDKKLPRINIEEAFAYEKPAIIFEDAFILDEETGFDLYAYVLSQGPQRIMPIGIQLNRVPNKLMTTNTGAALL